MMTVQAMGWLLLVLAVTIAIFNIIALWQKKNLKAGILSVLLALVGVLISYIGLINPSAIEKYLGNIIISRSQGAVIQGNTVEGDMNVYVLQSDEEIKRLSAEYGVIIEQAEVEASSSVPGMIEGLIRNKKLEKVWTKSILGDLDSVCQVKCSYRNVTDQTANNVVIQAYLPDYLQTIPNSVVLYNANNLKGISISGDISNGINIGDYASGAIATVTFDVKVVDNGMSVGVNLLKTWIEVKDEKGASSRDYADVYVYRTTSGVQPVDFSNGTVEVADVGVAAVDVVSDAYWFDSSNIVSYKHSGEFLMHGKSYNQGFTTYNREIGYVYIQCDKKYSKLKYTLGHIDNTARQSRTIEISILGDDGEYKTIFSKRCEPDMPLLEDQVLDIKNTDTIRIWFSANDNAWNAQYALAELYLME